MTIHHPPAIGATLEAPFEEIRAIAETRPSHMGLPRLLPQPEPQQALALAQEAMARHRELAAQQPEAFRPDLREKN